MRNYNIMIWLSFAFVLLTLLQPHSSSHFPIALWTPDSALPHFENAERTKLIDSTTSIEVSNVLFFEDSAKLTLYLTSYNLVNAVMYDVTLSDVAHWQRSTDSALHYMIRSFGVPTSYEEDGQNSTWEWLTPHKRSISLEAKKAQLGILYIATAVDTAAKKSV